MALENRRFLSQLPSPHLRDRIEEGTRGCGWSGLLSLDSPLLVLLSLLRAHPCALRARRGSWRGEEGVAGAGEACGWTRVRRHLLRDPCVPAPRRLASRASADAAVTAGRVSIEGGRGCPTVAGTAVQAPSCGARLFPT